MGGVVFMLVGAWRLFRQHAVYPLAADKRAHADVIAASHGLANVCRAVGGLAGVGNAGSGGFVVAAEVSD